MGSQTMDSPATDAQTADSPATDTGAAFVVRRAEARDRARVLEGLSALLAELRNQLRAPVPAGAEAAFQRVLAEPALGAIWLATASQPDNPEDGGERLHGYISISHQWALRTGGPYGIVQELWVHPDRRSSGVGEALIEAAARGCAAAGIQTLEVGLPSARFPALARVSSFYQRCGFTEIGTRMRRVVEAEEGQEGKKP